MSSSNSYKSRKEIASALQAALGSAQPNKRSAAPAISADREALREAAAVIGPFSPEEMTPPHPKPTKERKQRGPVSKSGAVVGSKIAEITPDCDVVSQGQWLLNFKVRKEVLANLVMSGRLGKALARTSHLPKDPYRPIFREFSTGKLRRLEERSLDELRHLKQVLIWFGDSAPVYLDPRDIDDMIERQYLVDPFRRLARHFRGRASELDMLRDFVEVYQGSDMTEQAYRGFRGSLGISGRRPQVIWGPGGIGKSALIGRFILDHIEIGNHGSLQVTGPEKIPFAYLDFDKVALDPLRPETLYLEIATQLVRQYRDTGLEKLIAEWGHRVRRSERRGSRTGSEGPRLPNVRSDANLVAQMAEIFVQWSRDCLLADGEPPPFLLVLDTFEEVQLGGEARERQTAEFVRQFSELYSRLRVVICGRAQIRFLRASQHNLGELHERDALLVLKDHGVEGSELRSMVVSRVGTNPLSLVLAAEAIAGADIEDQSKVLADLKIRNMLFQRIDATEIQGQLYDRVLKHVRDLRLRRLAHPGLVVRRITAEVIREVLAEPCDLNPDDADELFEILGRNFSLVERNNDGSLQHRQDVRRLMLRNMINGTQYRQTMERIHRAAADYYANMSRPDGISRGEQVYHRLMLEDLAPDLKKLAREADRRSLELAWDDPLPPASKAWLTDHLGYESDEVDWDTVELESWERRIAQRSQELLDTGEAKRALDLLHERPERSSASPLYAIEATALEVLGKDRAALKVVQAALDSGIPSGQAAIALKLYQTAAALCLKLKKSGLFTQFMEKGTELAKLEEDKGAQLFFASLRHRWYETHEPQGPNVTKDDEATEHLIRTFLNTPKEAFQEESELTGQLLEGIGVQYPAMLAHAINVLKPVDLGPGGTKALASLLSHADRSEAFRQRKPALLQQIGVAERDAGWDMVANRAVEFGTLDQALKAVVEHGSLSPSDLDGVASIVRSGIL